MADHHTKLLLAISDILRGSYPHLNEHHDALLGLHEPPTVVKVGESGEGPKDEKTAGPK